MNDNVRALKHALENLDTGKSTFRRILTGILSKHSENSELKPNLSSIFLEHGVLRFYDLDKTLVKLFSNFSHHHLITHTNNIANLYILFVGKYEHCSLS